MDEDLYFVETRNADPRVIRPTTVVRTPVAHAPSTATATRVTYAPPPATVVIRRSTEASSDPSGPGRLPCTRPGRSTRSRRG